MMSRHMRSRVFLLVAVAVLSSIETGPAASAEPPDRDSLQTIVDMLSFDPSTSQARSRYVFREAELAGIADTLASRLERYTGIPALRQTFTIEHRFDDHDSVFTGENVIVRLPAGGEPSGVLLVTAHFDAIGRRSDGWEDDWEHQPAPGADDNATGVAVVLEAARILADAELPFDVEFVFFSAEELGRLGSIDYVSRCDAGCAEELLGVINLDMIGYSGEGRGASCLSDFRSGWLADLLIAHAASIDRTFPLTLVKPAPSNWDHGSFWEREPVRLPAVTLAEPLGPFGAIIYPWYHTVDDLPEMVDFGQVALIGSIVTDFIGAFEDAPEEMSLLPSDLLVLVEGAIRNENVFESGERLDAWIRVRNTGGAVPGGGSVLLTVTLENSQGRRTIFDDAIEPPPPLRSTDVTVPLSSGGECAGENRIGASIRVSGMNDSSLDNEAETSFVVTQSQHLLLGHHVRPNPVTSRFSESQFCVNLAGEADLMVELFTVEGERAGSARLGAGYGFPIPVGYSCHRCGDIFLDAADLASGIYIYRIVVYARSGDQEEVAGRFAVAN